MEVTTNDVCKKLAATALPEDKAMVLDGVLSIPPSVMERGGPELSARINWNAHLLSVLREVELWPPASAR